MDEASDRETHRDRDRHRERERETDTDRETRARATAEVERQHSTGQWGNDICDTLRGGRESECVHSDSKERRQ